MYIYTTYKTIYHTEWSITIAFWIFITPCSDEKRRRSSTSEGKVIYTRTDGHGPHSQHISSLRNVRGTMNKRSVLPLLHFLSHPMTASSDLNTGFSISNDAKVIVILPYITAVLPHGHPTRRTSSDASYKPDRGIA